MTDLHPKSTVEREPSSVPNDNSHPWLRGALISGLGVLIGMLALGLFCYSLGVNFQEEGWSETRQTHQGAMIVSLVGFALATLLFWVGFIQLTHARAKS